LPHHAKVAIGHPGMVCATILCFVLLIFAVATSASPYSPPQSANANNPFEDQTFYTHPANTAQFLPSIATASGTTRKNLEYMSKVPSAYWLDKAYKVVGTGSWSLEGILQDAASKTPPQLTVFIWYDLPNRDCDAKASNGEMCCYANADGTCNYEKTGDCAEGLERYKKEYCDPFVERLERYQNSMPIVIILEPDSLGNLATNQAHPHCGNIATQTAYKEGVQYAMQQLTSRVPRVSVYLDAAHGGWLGWENNMEKFMKSLKALDLPFHKIRGFATNVANYQPLGIQCPWCPDQGYRNGYCLNGKHQDEPCCADPCKLSSQYNFGNNEMNYAAGLVAAAKAALGFDAHVVIDTGRNGVVDQRQDCANWCNPRNSGAGVPSTVATANRSLVDAYFWLKTPGESDGCSHSLPNRSLCKRFDAGCASVDSLGSQQGEPHAPEAGAWYDYQVKQLAHGAQFNLPKGSSKSNSTCPVSMNSGGAPAPLVPVAKGTDANGNACIEAWTQCNYKADKNDPSCCGGCTCVGGPYFAQCTPAQPGGSCGPVPSTAVATSSSTRPTTSGQASTSLFGAAGLLAMSQPLQRVATPSTSKALRLAGPDLNPLFAPKATTAVPAGSGLRQRSSVSKVVTGKACQKIWGQCSGKTTVGGKQVNWPGPFCCEGGCTCENNGNGQYYGQCRPPNNGWQCTAPQRLSDIGTKLPGGIDTATRSDRFWLAPILAYTVFAALLVSLLVAVAAFLRVRFSQRLHRQVGHGMHYSLVGYGNAPPRRQAEPPLLEQ